MSKVSSIRIGDLIPLAWSALRRNRLRSTLTIGAIAFGVAVMVYLVSLGLGLENLTVGSVLRSSTLLSFNVSSFNKDIKPLNGEALQRIQSISTVKKALPQLSLKGEVALGTKRAPVTVVGVDPDFFSASDNKNQLQVGRPFVDGETNTMLVSTSFLKLFGLNQDKTPLITFDLQVDRDYGTVPVIKDITVRGIIQDDNAITIYLPRLYLESLMSKDKPDYQQIKVLVDDLSNIEPASAAVIAEGYRVTTVVDTVEEIKRIFGYIQVTMAVLGGIAIVVASIGMFNTLTVSLLERTREIGIMKALGIKRGDVRRLFLTEALLIGILGGIIGILLALAFQQLTLFIFQVLALIARGNVPRLFINYWYLPVGSLAFSMLIAALTGFYPANRAAKLNPIEAIRHE
jgi:ABC-type lipoprotein release transport system permease subunit